MTTNKSSLKINKMIVLKDGKRVYDQKFENGVNIIAGDNGTGKSSIANLLYYVLGGEKYTWTEEVSSCDSVLCEVEINKNQLTLIRDINSHKQNNLKIYDKPIDLAIKNYDQWQVFPYRRSSQKKSFSEILFEYLEYPNCKTDESANLTMHQLLRLMYIDQMSTQDTIFMNDSDFDTKSIRKAIGEFMLGIDNLDIHELRQKYIIDGKAYSALISEVKAIKKFLKDDEVPLEEMELQKQLNDLQNEKIRLENEISNLELSEENKIAMQHKTIAKKLNININKICHKINDLNDSANQLKIELEDSKYFIATLEERIESIKYSEITSKFLGEIQFKYCPVCLSPIENTNESECHLCKNQNEEILSQSYLRIKTELEFQIKESKQLLESRNSELEDIERKVGLLEKNKYSLQSQYKQIINDSNVNKSLLVHLSTSLGYVDKTIEDLKDKNKYFDKLSMLESEKSKKQSELRELDQTIKNLEEESVGRKEHIYNLIAANSKEILKGDLDFEDAFKNPINFNFYFGEDKFILDGRDMFSASSMVILKNALRFSIFLSSLQDDDVRLPRFLLIDNVEDKGMQHARSQNFQKLMIETLNDYNKDFQLIFTTSMIHPDLRESDYIVGEYYEKGKHTLLL